MLKTVKDARALHVAMLNYQVTGSIEAWRR